MEYGQFCPIAKATEIIGEKWTLLIIRELLMGGSRFNELQRGLSLISPTILSKRLETLSEQGLVLKKKIPDQKGFEYFPTESCRQLLPIIRSLGDWGMCWARSNLTEKDYDVELLMLYLKRSIVPDNLIGDETVIRFMFTDIEKYRNWWLVVINDEIDLCVKDPGKNIDIYFTSTVKTMADIWMGDYTYKKAIKEGSLKLVGDKIMKNSITAWMSNSIFTDIPPASEI
ncbi:HxlR family transcriptional regulator [Methyloprofundus sedimenti]|uniref:HxlR family transcriptional regulator n=1 Tax=Methyloprofundus sedimenti TaxID=1420851 RepID=A0A1V8MAE5_9GAMM|nr:helix-turn-helix domain-containing protein [Methyloprofundus sedimenti]OQK18570.1 HxlR family transcriptional regulator [Methyloprofundus sedimenti]